MEKYIDLVKKQIKGNRDGISIPAYQHSLNVYNLLKNNNYSQNIQLAGLLHDIVEDGNIQLTELLSLWLPYNVYLMIDLCTHQSNGMTGWHNMINRLVNSKNMWAWAVKLADITDNLKDLKHMPDHSKIVRFLTVKCPVFIYYGNRYFWGTDLYNSFLEEYYKNVLLFI